ncbi:hypothetical protein [Streptomyces sp. NPDC056527]|uniref:hypothetical protein n=1 Tax=Streptomyces sp. NPDC056527 TaxID=3345853 RepID=UPI0036A823C6
MPNVIFMLHDPLRAALSDTTSSLAQASGWVPTRAAASERTEDPGLPPPMPAVPLIAAPEPVPHAPSQPGGSVSPQPPPPTPGSPLDARQLQQSARLREHVHRAQRGFLVANGVPLAAGISLSSFTDVPAVPVFGQLTVGLLWGLLQCGLLVATAWRYETRSARTCDPLEESLTSGLPDAATLTFGAHRINGRRAVDR